MRLRFDRYKELTGRLQWRSIVWLVVGGLGLAGGSLSGWLGLLMLFMTDGGIWERRSGMFLTIFTGFIPFALGALAVARGLSQRRELRVLRDLGALARQMPAFTVADVMRVLDVGPARAHRIVLDTMTKGVLEEEAHGAITPGPLAPPSPAHEAVSGDARTVADPHARTVSASAPVDSWIGAVLHGTYKIEGPVGSGGMGMVFRARHLRTGRAYAVKTLLPDAHLLPESLRRFEREATAASALGHPNIISVHDFNVTSDGIHYLVMDLLLGETLEQRLGRVGSLPWQDAQRWILEVGAGLAAAHEHGLLHRDVKPGNIFLARAGTTERAVLLDFGLVKPSDDAAVSRITASGAAIGTPLYMSPEQARGESVDARSDLYALSAVLFEMVTGAPPFPDRTLASVYAQLLTAEAPTASAVADRSLPPELDAVLARGLARSREERFADVRAFLDAVQSIAEAQNSGTREPARAVPR